MYAQKATQGAIRRAKEIGITVAIAVVDSNLKVVFKWSMEATLPEWLDESIGKAMTSVRYGGKPSDEVESLAEFAKKLRGGMPLYKDGKLLGAIGVTGALSEENRQIAAAGVAAV